jgi:DNA-directed RNA polymerase
MSKEKSGLGKFVVGAAIGAGLGVLFAPKSGNETRKVLKVKIDDLVTQIKKIDVDEVKAEFDKKIDEIKAELADLDKEKALDIAKEKSVQLKNKAQELVDLAVEKGTPVLKKSAQDVLDNVVKVSKEAIKKLEEK